jgi:hypothetical protein
MVLRRLFRQDNWLPSALPSIVTVAAAFILWFPITSSASTKTKYTENSGLSSALNCDFETECSWDTEPPTRFRTINGKGLRDIARENNNKEINGPLADMAGSNEG